MRYTKNLTFLTTGYDQLADIFPLLVAAPRYFSGAISLGVLTQIGNAFGRGAGRAVVVCRELWIASPIGKRRSTVW